MSCFIGSALRREFREELENVVLARDYLIEHPTICLFNRQVVRPQGGGAQPVLGSARTISEWLDKSTGRVMNKTKNYIGEIQSIIDDLENGNWW